MRWRRTIWRMRSCTRRSRRTGRSARSRRFASSANAVKPPLPPPPPPMLPRAWRSKASMVRATRQPSSTSPTTLATGTRTSSRKTSLKWDSPVSLAQRPHRDARHVHVDDEHGDALALGPRRVGPHEAGGVVAVLRARRPDLLALEHELVAVAPGPGLHAREVRARAGLAEQLAPDVVAAQQRRDERLLLLLAGVHQQRRPAHAEPDLERAGRDLEGLRLAVVDALVAAGQPPPAVLGRPRDAGQAGVGQLALVGDRTGQSRAAERDDAARLVTLCRQRGPQEGQDL